MFWRCRVQTFTYTYARCILCTMRVCINICNLWRVPENPNVASSSLLALLHEPSRLYLYGETIDPETRFCRYRIPIIISSIRKILNRRGLKLYYNIRIVSIKCITCTHQVILCTLHMNRTPTRVSFFYYYNIIVSLDVISTPQLIKLSTSILFLEFSHANP